MDPHIARLYRAKLQLRLATAERRVAEGEARIAKQRELIAELERCAYGTAIAHDTLNQFEELQKLHLADRARLCNALALWDQSDASAPAPK